MSSRSSSSESNAARADKMAALFGAVDRSSRMSSAVSVELRGPRCRRDVSTAKRSNSSLSKTLRREGGS